MQVLLFTAVASAQTSKVIYTCPMHPEVQQSKPGNCPKCGMTLEKKTVKVAAPKKTVKKPPAKQPATKKPATTTTGNKGSNEMQEVVKALEQQEGIVRQPNFAAIAPPQAPIVQAQKARQ